MLNTGAIANVDKQTIMILDNSVKNNSHLFLKNLRMARAATKNAA